MSYKLLELFSSWPCTWLKSGHVRATLGVKQAASASGFLFNLVWFEISKRNFLLAPFLFWLHSFRFWKAKPATRTPQTLVQPLWKSGPKNAENSYYSSLSLHLDYCSFSNSSVVSLPLQQLCISKAHRGQERDYCSNGSRYCTTSETHCG